MYYIPGEYPNYIGQCMGVLNSLGYGGLVKQGSTELYGMEGSTRQGYRVCDENDIIGIKFQRGTNVCRCHPHARSKESLLIKTIFE